MAQRMQRVKWALNSDPERQREGMLGHAQSEPIGKEVQVNVTGCDKRSKAMLALHFVSKSPCVCIVSGG